MKDEFNFDSVGKKTPYRIPEGVFEEVQNYVVLTTKARSRRFMLVRRITVSLAAAAVLLGVMLIPGVKQPVRMEQVGDDALAENSNWIENMSDEDLAYMESIYDCDIFMY